MMQKMGKPRTMAGLSGGGQALVRPVLEPFKKGLSELGDLFRRKGAGSWQQFRQFFNPLGVKVLENHNFSFFGVSFLSWSSKYA
jgi:hypothetical protein